MCNTNVVKEFKESNYYLSINTRLSEHRQARQYKKNCTRNSDQESADPLYLNNGKALRGQAGPADVFPGNSSGFNFSFYGPVQLKLSEEQTPQ